MKSSTTSSARVPASPRRAGLSQGCVFVVGAVVLLVASAPSVSQETSSIGMSLGVTHTDNVSRVAENEDPQTSGQLGLQFDWTRDAGRLVGDVSADLQYNAYFDDTYDDELLGSLAGEIAYWLVPERLGWVVQQNFGQTLIEPQLVLSPDNRQNVSFFTTGPDLVLPLGQRTDMSLQGRWSSVNYSDFDGDSERLSGTIGLIRALGRQSTVSINGMAERVEFDTGPPNSDYDRQSIYAGVETSGSRTSLTLRAGYTAVHDYEDTIDAPLFYLALSRQLSSRSVLTLNLGTELTDSADAFRRDQSIGGVSTDEEGTVIARDVFTSDYAVAAWQHERDRSTVLFTAEWRQEDHDQDATLNRESVSAGIGLSRRLGQRLSVALGADWTREDYEDAIEPFEEWSATLELDWKMGAAWSLVLSGERNEGSGETPFGGNRDYVENRATLSVAYRPGR